MELLVRDVSAYTEWTPVFLGLFSTEAKALAARANYLSIVAINDPLHEQV